MSNVVDFKEALLRKNDEDFGLRQIIPNDFVKKALAAGRAHEDRVNQAIFDLEVAKAKWRCKNVRS